MIGISITSRRKASNEGIPVFRNPLSPGITFQRSAWTDPVIHIHLEKKLKQWNHR